ncbi:MAG: M48 family metalloprotease [Magnetococcales bacterium]|nr:M48 family metalloprotease [Magnetococcales bacterium]
MNIARIGGVCLLLLWVMPFCTTPVRAEGSNLNHVATLLTKKYGVLEAAGNPQVARVQQIFERVQSVADKRGNRLPQFSVVDAPEHPWAIALPDGHILLSSGAIQLCYHQVTPAEGDSRVAFVLGHELAHLAKNDFWDPHIYLAMAGEGEAGRKGPPEEPKSTAAERSQRRALAWHRESEADDMGFLYAGIAGYPVHTLLGRADEPHDNFFSLWSEPLQGVSALHELHPPPLEREAFLRRRLERLTEALPFFRWGVRLAHGGRCDQATVLFRHFLHIFPAREVYNNLGACHLQQVRRQQTKELPPYWLPLFFDAESRAAPLRRSGSPTERLEEVAQPSVLPEQRGHLLEQAVEYLQQAVEADAAYLPARLNLATAYFYQGELLKARAALEEALPLAPHNREVAGWHALLLYLDSQAHGLGEAALSQWTPLIKGGDAPLSVLFNHALLLEKRGKKAKNSWTRLASRQNLLPAPHAQVACRAARLACSKGKSAKPFPWVVPVQPGADMDTLARDKRLTDWQHTPLGWLQDKQPATLYRRGEEVELLDVDGTVAMVVLRGQKLGTRQTLQKKAGAPDLVQALAEGEVWHYTSGWAVLLRDGLVREAWLSQSKP